MAQQNQVLDKSTMNTATTVACAAGDDEAIERQQQVERSRSWAALIAAVGRRYETARLSSFEITNEQQRGVVESLHEFAAGLPSAISEGRNVILYGPRGTGKDHLLVAMLRAAIGEGFNVAWRDGQTMYGEFRAAIDNGVTEADVLRPLTAPNVLAVSDPTPPVGDLKSDYQRAMLFRVVDRRYRDLKPIWVTLNAANAEEAEKRLTPNIIDRLSHNALVLRCNWKSYRTGR